MTAIPAGNLIVANDTYELQPGFPGRIQLLEFEVIAGAATVALGTVGLGGEFRPHVDAAGAAPVFAASGGRLELRLGTMGKAAVKVTAIGALASATGTLTLTENAAAANTVTIGSTVYTFRAAPAVAGEVLLGADASGSIDNLIAAINGDALNAAHPDVTAAIGAGDTMVITAKVQGPAGNDIATTDTLAGASAWGAVKMAGGASAGQVRVATTDCEI